MSQIVPAILETTKEGFLEKVSKVVKLPGLKTIQVDFGDGQFIKNKLLPASEMHGLNPAFEWEAHLMVKAPQDFLDYQICGFKTIILHYEAYETETDLRKAITELKDMGFRASVAINPDTPVNVLKNIDTSQYLIMSVVPGKQGQRFITSSLEKIKFLRELKPNAIIEVDGGAQEINVKDIKEAGADLICVGSALVKADDVGAVYENLVREIQ